MCIYKSFIEIVATQRLAALSFHKDRRIRTKNNDHQFLARADAVNLLKGIGKKKRRNKEYKDTDTDTCRSQHVPGQ